MNTIFTRLCAVGILCAAALFTGCGTPGQRPPPPGPPFSYIIRFDDNSLADANVKVDVLKVNSSTRADIEGIALADYFAPESPVRASAPVVRKYVLTAGKTETLDLKDFKEIHFPDYSHIAILEYPPYEVKLKDGKSDDRRKLLPLDPKKWPRKGKWPGKDYEVTIKITRALGVQVEPGWNDNGQ